MSNVWFSLAMNTTYLISFEVCPGTVGTTGDDIDAWSARRSTIPLSARTSAVSFASSVSDGTSSTLSTPRMLKNSLCGIAAPPFGPFPNPRKQMQTS